MSGARQHVLIDQATGWLAGRLDCGIGEAAEHLASLARDTGTSVAEAAALLLDDGTTPTVPQQVDGPAASGQDFLVPEQPSAERRSPDTPPQPEAAARAKIETERREATLRMQQAILPMPEYQFRHGRYDIAVRYQPAQSGNCVGGDWYEARAWTGGAALVTIGDVAGHGLAAAAGMARIGNALRGMTVTGQPPDRLLTWLNDLVCTDEIPERVASAAVGALEQNPPRLRWAQAGHPPPVLVRHGEPRLLARPAGLLLGTVPDARYELATEDLTPGDRLVFYTDGLIERRDCDIDESLLELLKATTCCQDATAKAGAEELAARLSYGADDDICVLVVSVTSSPLVIMPMDLRHVQRLRLHRGHHELAQRQVAERYRAARARNLVDVDAGLRHFQQLEAVEQPGRGVPERARSGVDPEELVRRRLVRRGDCCGQPGRLVVGDRRGFRGASGRGDRDRRLPAGVQGPLVADRMVVRRQRRGDAEPRELPGDFRYPLVPQRLVH